VKRRLIVDGDFLAWLDIAECDKEDMTIEYFHVAVGLAGMVYVMRSVPAPTTVETPTLIDRADTESSPPGAAVSFGIRYSLAGILRYLSTASKNGL
jgi:hypothetical protein